VGTLRDVRLAEARRRKMLTQVELAVASGVSPQTISNLERGLYGRPQVRVMRRIAEALGVEPAAVDEFRTALGLPDDAPAEDR